MEFDSSLCIEKRVPEKKLFALKKDALLGKLVPLFGLRPHAPELEPVFKIAQLLDEVDSDLQIGPARIEEFKCLEQGPAVLAHDVSCQNARSSALAPH